MQGRMEVKSLAGNGELKNELPEKSTEKRELLEIKMKRVLALLEIELKEGECVLRQMVFAFTSKLARLIAPDRFGGVEHELARKGITLKGLAKLLPRYPDAARKLERLDLKVNGLTWSDPEVAIVMRGASTSGRGIISRPEQYTEEAITRVIDTQMTPCEKDLSAQLLLLLKILSHELGTGEGLLVL